MPTITALKVQKRNKRRVNVYLDDAFAFGLAMNAALELRVGQTLTADDVEALRAADDVEKAYERALNFLSYRPRSEAEVRRNLAKHDTPPALIETVLERLRRARHVDDAAFTALWVENRTTFRPRGRWALRSELRQKGITDDLIDAALADLDETAAARAVVAKQAPRLAKLPAPKYRQKMYGYLARRGFETQTIQSVLDELITTSNDIDDPRLESED